MKLSLYSRLKTINLPRRRQLQKLKVDSPIAIVGDIHGRADLLDKMLELLQREAPDAHLVFVGDYIDRGPHSALTLQILKSLPNAACLMGNHERMCLDFLEAPIQNGERWRRFGGQKTLASFGVRLGLASALRDELESKMGPDLIKWLSQRPLYIKTGSLYVTHAIPDPNQAIETQKASNLLWGHSSFPGTLRKDGFWVVHGHTIVTKARAAQGKISIDTGAFATGELTAAVIDDSIVRLLSVVDR